jgi:hypothetical protein
MMPLRCGRLDDHAPHAWTRPRTPFLPQRTWHCNGHVVTECAEREWASEADLAEAQDDELRDRLMGWGAA